MNILYIGYWSVKEGLSVATILPHLEVLSNMNEIVSITYISIEREELHVDCDWDIPKMQHKPHYSPHKPLFMDKFYDFIQLPKLLAKLCKEQDINKVICRGSPAGGLGYLLWRKTRIPYYVESFEPHANYMLEGKVWSRYDLRYLLQQYFEKKQKETAAGLMPVSYNYEQHLKTIEKINCPIETIPCWVDLEKFKFNPQLREYIRKKHNIDKETVVGIYVGKFGDIYYEDESFRFFKSCHDHFTKFFLFLLCPQTEHYLERKLHEIKFPIDNCWKGIVEHKEVVNYLNAADFAFCPVKSTANRKFCSPVKNGEYWANGLPIIISDGIGDDSDIIKEKGGGMVIDFQSKSTSDEFKKTKVLIINSKKNRKDNPSVSNAAKYRDKLITKLVYHKFLLNENIR